MTPARDSLQLLETLPGAAHDVRYFRLARLGELGLADLSRWPYTLKVLLEAVVRGEDGETITAEHIRALAGWRPQAPRSLAVPFLPARVLLQDFTGVPTVVDLAAMRSAMARLGGDPRRINPQIPVDLVIDHSVQVDLFNSPRALAQNAALELERNRERYTFLRWGQQAFEHFSVVPPASGIVHQVNLEHLARVVQVREGIAYADSLVGTDSHTTMINGLGVLGWGVGGIEAEAVMLGQPLDLLVPAVTGVRLRGALPAGATATDLVLRVTQLLREHGVVGRFVEFCGPGLAALSLADRATVANMAPEYGATVGFFPVDGEALRYLRATGRPAELVALVERYCRAQGLFRSDECADPEFDELLALDLEAVEPSVAGPKRPQDRVPLQALPQSWQCALGAPSTARGFGVPVEAQAVRAPLTLEDGEHATLAHGSVAIAAITSCTNTSNPQVMLAAGLLAKKAVEAGLRRPPHVKTSLAPGSRVVTAYLRRTGLLPYLEQLGFYVVGYGCTTCIGNSGPLPEAVVRAVEEQHLVVAAVLSGNRNFDGRINPHVRASYLASPPLVVAFALAGRVDCDLTREPLGAGSQGQPVYLRDLWPSNAEVSAHLAAAYDASLYREVYADLAHANEQWNQLAVHEGELYAWDPASTYIQEPPFFRAVSAQPAPLQPIVAARVLVKLGDSVTTDHISPAGAIAEDSAAGRYLRALGVAPQDFNSYGSRRGNDRVMTRGTFANVRLRNELAPGTEGGWTTHLPSGERLSIYEAAQRYQQAGVPSLVLAGRDYGMGSSRDWAAKGTALLGVRAVLARSFERIHRSNLVGMGVLPLEYRADEQAEALGLTGSETYSIALDEALQPGQELEVTVRAEEGTTRSFMVRCRLDTPGEVSTYRQGGILPAVLRRLCAAV